ncbi:MAG TPA: hypothetical protein PLC79_11935, partial [Phycisphaerae bacterium]|nr:hypothetical protein [Phycisphaerae bacterium]
EVAARVLSDADAEMQRMRIWLETEQHSYWRNQIQKRSELVARAKDAVLSKKLYKNIDGTRAAAIEEEKALQLAVRRLEEANHKFENVRRYTQRLQKELLLYQGQVQRLANAVQTEVPMAAARLEDLVASLEAYVAGGQPEEPVAAAETAEEPRPATPPPAESMARPVPPPETDLNKPAADEDKPDDAGGRQARTDPAGET